MKVGMVEGHRVENEPYVFQKGKKSTKDEKKEKMNEAKKKMKPPVRHKSAPKREK